MNTPVMGSTCKFARITPLVGINYIYLALRDFWAHICKNTLILILENGAVINRCSVSPRRLFRL